METKITQDEVGTHIDWSHDGVTPRMIDWFWSNMEKGFLLWHPAQHEPLQWAVPVKHGNPIGSIHIAPQTWNDGTRQNLYIRMEKLEDVPVAVRDYICYEHVVLVAGLGLGEEALTANDPLGFRLHQYQKTDAGVVGKSTAVGARKKENHADGLVWAAHCVEEIGSWGDFLPQLYNLFKVVKNTNYNPFADLSVDGKGREARYKYIA